MAGRFLLSTEGHHWRVLQAKGGSEARQRRWRSMVARSGSMLSPCSSWQRPCQGRLSELLDGLVSFLSLIGLTDSLFSMLSAATFLYLAQGFSFFVSSVFVWRVAHGQFHFFSSSDQDTRELFFFPRRCLSTFSLRGYIPQNCRVQTLKSESLALQVQTVSKQSRTSLNSVPQNRSSVNIKFRNIIMFKFVTRN